MFSFDFSMISDLIFGDQNNAKVELLRPKRIRDNVVVASTNEIRDAEKISNNLPGDNDVENILTPIFDKYSANPDSLYTIFYKTEQFITEWEDELNKPLAQRIKELKEDAAADKKNADKHDEEIEKLNEQISRNETYADEKRRRLYEGYFEHLHKKFGEDKEKIDNMIFAITDWHVSRQDSIHNNMIRRMHAFRKAREKQEAYGNPWYMVGMGAFVTVVGGAFLIASLVTGFAAPFVFVFGAITIGGIALALLSGKTAAQELLAYRVNNEAEASLRSQSRIQTSKKFKKQHDNFLSRITWQSALFFAAGLAGVSLLLADIFLGGALNALGSAIKIKILEPMGIPNFNVSIPEYSFSDTGYWVFDPLFKYFLNPIGEMFSGMGTPFTTGAIDFALIGLIGWAGVALLSKITDVSDNKTFKRAHTAIQSVYNAVYASYTKIGMVAMFFGAELVSMFVLPIAVAALGYSAYQYFYKKETYLTLPAYLEPMKAWLPDNHVNSMLYSALAITVCALSLFVFASSPIGFGMLILVGAALYGIAQDQINATAAAHNAKTDREHMRVEMHDKKSHEYEMKPLNNKNAADQTNKAQTETITYGYKDASGKKCVAVAQAPNKKVTP